MAHANSSSSFHVIDRRCITINFFSNVYKLHLDAPLSFLGNLPIHTCRTGVGSTGRSLYESYLAERKSDFSRPWVTRRGSNRLLFQSRKCCTPLPCLPLPAPLCQYSSRSSSVLNSLPLRSRSSSHPILLVRQQLSDLGNRAAENNCRDPDDGARDWSIRWLSPLLFV